jgi:hypothetical protein
MNKTNSKENTNNNNSQKEIQKPLTVAREDFMIGITELINQSHLPFFIVEDCLKNITSDIHTLAVEQERQEREIYQNQLNLKESDKE